MSFTCRTCRRMNPPEAQYCYFDGVALDAAHVRGPVAAGALPFPTPFVLPSGRSCGSFDQLVLACDADWDDARSVLQKGFLEGFLGGLGRVDLAMAARQAAASPDLDSGLDELLAKLPSTVREPAKLQVAQREIDLGEMPSGSEQRLMLNLKNLGMGLLQGTVSCSETPWLAVGDAPAGPQKRFQCRQDLALPVHVVGKALRANAKPLAGKLVVESNGGVIEIPVRVRVPIRPFPDGVLAGAKTPRQVAEKAKLAPKDAAVLFASGAVAAWYESNGWTYPVQGPSATGLGAVQQFFEALGLVTAPKVAISTQSVQFRGVPGAHLEQIIQVATAEKRPVYAHAVSKSAWLSIGKVQLKGQTAHIPLLIPSVPSMPGEELHGRVEVAANGNQSFTVNVTLTIGEGAVRSVRVAAESAAVVPLSHAMAGPALEVMAAPPLPPRLPPGPPPLFPSPVATMPPLPGPAAVFDFQTAVDVERVPAPFGAVGDARSPHPARGDSGGKLKHLLPLLLLGLGLGGMLLHDFLLPARDDQQTEEASLPEVPVDPEPYISLHFHEGHKDQMPKELATILADPTMRFGLEMERGNQGDPKNPSNKKNIRLTFDKWGLSNNTVIRVGRDDFLFGGTTTPKYPSRGQWVERATDKDEKGRKIKGLISSWRLDGPKVLVTQQVEIVPSEVVAGEKTRRLDTCLVRYQLKNEDSVEHQVGLRFLLDTFIGSSDGVPFTIPGRPDLCDTREAFETPSKVPDFIQVLEKDDPRNPGTVARLQFRVGKQIEAPTRVLLGGWPAAHWKLEDHPDANGPLTLWDVPKLSMKEHTIVDRRTTIKYPLPADSAVTLYWDEKPLSPGATRTVGFAYGLGSVSSQESEGKLLLSVGGRMAVGSEFTLTALVPNPMADETLTLTTPAGLELKEGSVKEKVPPVPPQATRAVSAVTWKIQPKKAGEYKLVVKSSRGVSQTITVQIRPHGVFDCDGARQSDSHEPRPSGSAP